MTTTRILKFRKGQRVRHISGRWTGSISEEPNVLKNQERFKTIAGVWVYSVTKDDGTLLIIAEDHLVPDYDKAA